MQFFFFFFEFQRMALEINEWIFFFQCQYSGEVKTQGSLPSLPAAHRRHRAENPEVSARLCRRFYFSFSSTSEKMSIVGNRGGG